MYGFSTALMTDTQNVLWHIHQQTAPGMQHQVKQPPMYLGALDFGSSVLAKQLPAGGVEGLAVVPPLSPGVGLPTPHLKLLHPAGVQLILRQLKCIHLCYLQYQSRIFANTWILQ